ncbi:MAG: hypothetical protein ACRC5W_10715 [Cetobacterium sp.]
MQNLNYELNENLLKLENKINELIKYQIISDTLVKINERDSFINNEFKYIYKQIFKPKKYEYIPNLWDLINYPENEYENEYEKEFYNYWIDYFLYPK